MSNLDVILRPEPGKQPGIIPQKLIERKPRSESQFDGVGNVPTTPVQKTHLTGTALEEGTKLGHVNKILAEKQIVELELKSNVVDWGQYIILNWKHKEDSFATKTDWVGIFKKREPTNTHYISYAYITMDNNGKSGSMSIPAPYVSGEYEFRYFNMGSYTVFGVSDIVKVGPQFKMTPEIVNQTSIKITLQQLTDSSISFKTWIAMYSSDKLTHSEFYSYQWVTPNVPTTFTVPKCGKWFFRLFNNSSRYDYLTCCEAFIEGKDVITLNQTSQDLIVTFDLKSVDLSYESTWLGIFRKDETLMNMYEQYKYISEVRGEFKMNKLRTGEWEARLFSNAQEGVISKSNIIQVK